MTGKHIDSIEIDSNFSLTSPKYPSIEYSVYPPSSFKNRKKNYNKTVFLSTWFDATLYP